MGSIGVSPSIGKACSPLTGGRRLREMLQDPSKVVVCPGVFDGLTARLALAAGYEALYMVSCCLPIPTHQQEQELTQILNH
jgi:hypothetical protein